MVVIIGGGVTGASIAYYLTKLSSTSSGASPLYPVTIIDAVVGKICGGDDGASSKVGAGAFLAESWGDGTKTEILHRNSFQMHSELATELEVSSYQEIQAFRIRDFEGGNNNEENTISRGVATNDNYNNVDDQKARIPWLSGVAYSQIPGRAAQVDPAELTKKMLEASLQRGTNLQVGTVIGFDSDICDDDDEGTKQTRKVTAIHLKDGEIMQIPSDENVVLSIGPWSSVMEDWLDIPMPIEGVSSTSLLWENCTDSSEGHVLPIPVAFFCNEDSNGCHLEILPRKDGSLYVSGCGGSRILSPAVMSANVIQPGKTNQPDKNRAEAATKSTRSFFSALSISDVQNLEPKARSCIRPVSPNGAPVLGQVCGFENVYVATGGGPWGVTWAPIIGLSMANLLLGDDSPPINIRLFSPRRFDTFVYKTLLKERRKEVKRISENAQW